ncbi:hypothetical protein GCM10012319_02270 [Comamonas sp. KCTC 72670]|nr:hypothetical protein GCM10012319_02270 [Comamonas sp. KCTC 72670]
MPSVLPRAVLPVIASALLTTACGTDPTGECRGTHLGARVNWPIDVESSRLERRLSGSLGNRTVQLNLRYIPNGDAGLTDFGAFVRLVDNAKVSNGPVTVLLVGNGGARLVPESTSLVLEWDGIVGTRGFTGSGYPEASGVPLAGSVTLAEVTGDFAAGHYVYHFADGSELTCTFNIPTPARADGLLGGDVDVDDDDDDD